MCWARGGALNAAIVAYAVAILGFVRLTEDLTFAPLSADPLFASYSIAVVVFVLGRFVLALAFPRRRSPGQLTAGSSPSLDGPDVQRIPRPKERRRVECDRPATWPTENVTVAPATSPPVTGPPPGPVVT